MAQFVESVSSTDKAFVFLNNVTEVFSITAAGEVQGPTNSNLILKTSVTSTDNAGRTIRLNSITNTGTANSFIGFQSKPRQGASTAQNVIGGEISAQVSDAIALTGSGTAIGLHSDVYLRGTSAGTIAGDVRAAQLELVTDDAGTRTITGDVVGLRIRSAFSATGITGDFVPFKVEKAETQTNSQQYDALFKLTGDNGLIWKDDYTTEVTTIAGAIKVIVNDQVRYIALYSGAPVI